MGRGVMVLVVCALLLGGAILTRPWEQEEEEPPVALASAAAAVGQPQARSEAPATPGRSVTLSDTQVVLRFPEGYQLAADPGQLAAAGAEASCPDGFDYCVYTRAAPEAEAAGLGVSVREDLESEAECVLEPLPGFEGALPTVVGSADHATARFGAVARPAAESSVTSTLRRLHFGGVCYEFVARIVTSPDQDPGAARADLAAIVDGLTLPDGRSDLWAAGR